MTERDASRRPVLLIGSAGLVGRHLRIAFRHHKLVATCHATSGDDGVPLDITDHDASRSLLRETRPNVVLLAAADPHVEHCERDPEATRKINVDAARPIADEASSVGAMLVVFSSEYVFDGTKGHYGEEDAVRPINEYGRQKVELEAIGRSVPRHLICRTSGVFGEEPAGKNFVCQLEHALRAGHPFAVPSDQLITPTYAPALAEAIAALVDANVTGTVHVAGPRVLRRTEFAEIVCRAFGLDASLLRARATGELGLAAPRPRRAGLADTKLRRLLGHGLLDPQAALLEMRAQHGGRPQTETNGASRKPQKV